MNVLIYSGPETLPQSLNHTTTTLRALLLPHYSVQPISLNALTTQPWTISCALLVLPRCTTRLTPKASDLIQKFVETGGSLLAFSVGASIPALRDQAQESLLLAFFDETTRNPIHLTFHAPGDGDQLSRTTTIRAPDGDLINNISDSGSMSFDGFDPSQKNVRVLGSYADGTLAGVQCTIGRGKIVIWAASLESPMTQGLSSAIVSTSLPNIPSEDRRRLDLIRTTLPLLLPASSAEQTPVSHPLPQFLSSTSSSPTLISRIASAIAAPSPGSQLSIFKDDNDTFHFHTLSESGTLLETRRENPPASTTDPAQWQPKHIILCTHGALPKRDQTPLFDHGLYYEYLSQERKAQHLSGTATGDDGVWALGEALLYGEVVTSTQTMLDKSVFSLFLYHTKLMTFLRPRNPRLLARLPPPLVSLASYQLLGRGRGSNIWLSPAGGLLFSIHLQVSLAEVPASKLVFVQYLFSLAVAEAFRGESVLGPTGIGKSVRLKWPNDIYVVVDGDNKKIGGVLVNTSFGKGAVDLVVGKVLALPFLVLYNFFSLIERMWIERPQ